MSGGHLAQRGVRAGGPLGRREHRVDDGQAVARPEDDAVLPDKTCGNRRRPIDAVGLRAGRTTEETRIARQRHLRHLRRQGAPDRSLVGRLDGDAELSEGGLVRHRVLVIGAEQLHLDGVEGFLAPRDRRPERSLGERRLRLDVESCKEECHRRAVTADVVEGDLGRVGRRLTGDTRDPHAVGAARVRRQTDRVETGRHVRIEVLLTADLVEELRRHRPDRDGSAVRGVFRDDGGPVIGDLGDREPGVLETLDLLKEGVIAAGRLGAALDDVAGHDAAGECVPIVASPSVVPGGRPERQRRVGHSSCHDDVGTSPERLRDPPPAEIGVCRQHVPIAERLAGVEVAELASGRPKLGHPRFQVVALDEGDDR